MNCRSRIDEYFQNKDELYSIFKYVLASFILNVLYCVDLILFESWIGLVYNKYLWGLIIFRRGANSFFKKVYIFKFFVALGNIIVSLILVINHNNLF